MGLNKQFDFAFKARREEPISGAGLLSGAGAPEPAVEMYQGVRKDPAPGRLKVDAPPHQLASFWELVAKGRWTLHGKDTADHFYT